MSKPGPGLIASGIFTCLVLTMPSVTHSHPAVSVVMDSKGNIYYSDLRRVWRMAPDGRTSVAVPNVHTHELWLDAGDTLYGEHLWYEGEATDRWGHRVWRLTPDGKLEDVIPARNGFREDYGDFSFVRDGDGAMYWAERADTTTVWKRSRDGTRSVVARRPFRDVRWMTVSPGGVIYLTDLADLVRIGTDGSVTSVAKNLPDWHPRRFLAPDRHAVMGLWTDRSGNVYAAVASNGLVKKFTPDGSSYVVARASIGWGLSGGMTDSEGNIWVLENGLNKSRVRKVQRLENRE